MNLFNLLGGGCFPPTGTIINFMGTNAPKGYLVCDGTVYNISDYPDLANHFETDFGTKNNFGGDGTTTFAVPDLRGEFLRGSGINSHTNQGSGGNVGQHQDGTMHPHAFTYGNGTSDYWVGGFTLSSGTASAYNADFSINNSFGMTYAKLSLDTSNGRKNQATRYSSRPTNTSILYCIKY